MNLIIKQNFKIYFLIFIVIIILIIRIFLLNYRIKYIKFSNKIEVECGIFGFLNKNSNSFIYMLFLIIFLIFDLEIILLLPQLLNINNFFLIIILTLILLRLILELFEISLKWND